MMVINAFFGIGGLFPEDFIEDRKRTMVPPDMNLDAAPMILPTKLVQIASNLARLDDLLGDGRPFLLGDSPCAADLSAYHPVMGLDAHERTAALLLPHERVRAWQERVRAIGHGKRSEMDSADAVAVAHDATPADFDGEPVLPPGMQIGTPVVVIHDDYGSGNVSGTLAASGLHEIAVRRRTGRVGEVVVHFPREDYSVIATE
jgi:hypothetical protein